MKKTQNIFASLAIMSMTLTTVPLHAFADSMVPTRIAGNTAAQTAAAIADQTGWTGIAILASSASYGMVDALTAGPLSTYLKAPILLTGPGNTLDPDTKNELTKLNVKTVYVTSGTAVISQAVLDQLSGMGISVISLGGQDRAETSVNIAKRMVGVTKVAVANGLQDALSIASVASAANEPILLTDKNSVPPSVAAYLTANPSITSSDVIGGTGVISDAVAAQFPHATRHFGNTAYDTNNQVIQDFSSSLKFDNVYVANGNTGIDALAGAPLAAMTNSPIVLTDGTVPAAAAYVHGKLAADAVVTALGGAAVVSDQVRTGILTGQVNNPGGPVAVTSVTAVSAASFEVKFSSAPADPSKVSFTVTNTGSPVTVTTSWDSTNTVATLSCANNLPEGSYAIDVQNNSFDLGTSTVAITAQKIAKITINSTKLAVTTANSTTAGGIGYATFIAQDQYGSDITSSYLANNITWTTGVGSITVPTHGVLQVTPNTMNLLTFSTVVITGYDSSSGVSTSATLNTSTAAGTLSSITLNKLINSNNAILTAQDTSNIWYIDYTAKDMSGNPTNDYNLVKNGLITIGTDYEITCSNPYVTAKVVQDPNDSNKAAIQVTVNSTSVQMDMPVTITAMCYGGTPSSLTLTLKKQQSVETFTLMAPNQVIASGEYKQIPFMAYDQNGVQLTRYSDLTNVILSPLYSNSSQPGAQLIQNPDGTASLWYQASTLPAGSNQSQPGVITASVPGSGKISTITINIQTLPKANTLTLNSHIMISSMEAPTVACNLIPTSAADYGAIEKVDFGYNYGGLTVNDQYGRPMDFTSLAKYGADGNRYQVAATTTGGSIALDQCGSDKEVMLPAGYGVRYAVANAGKSIEIRSLKPGQQTVRFYLYDTYQTANVSGRRSDGSTYNRGDYIFNNSIKNYNDLSPIDSKSVTYSVLQNKDIKGYTIAKEPNPIYAKIPATTNSAPTTAGAITLQQQEYEANPYVFGLTAGGGLVVLAGYSIQGAYVNSSDFLVDTENTGEVSCAKHTADAVYVAAKKLDPSKSSSSTTLTVTIKGADGLTHAVTTPITSSTTNPVAQSMGVYVDQTINGASLSDDGTTVYIKAGSDADTTGLAVGKYLSRYIPAAAALNVGGKNRAVVYFYAKDSYGTKGIDLASISLVGNTGDFTATNVTSNGEFSLNSDGSIAKNTLGQEVLSSSEPGFTKYVTVTGVTTSGLLQTVKIVYTK
ncbi:N-acetylmuramoyl-L-alanine amidase LytC precursor [Desulfosporosinus acididurans]|uniref:N-acetylmuramoyl-L-alanine amidase LytC n=1 Tax=Desulfosporosinus acididurans TaxID=476652 RepID=A0A0J1FV79_9FIRM|nr:cell wall-binding repeat-containing protein [Desulfosporosinus acididurans]KLU66888.1 N-acetylmuramoyl-L-alanine amidase LytC precursor [Desulfosporosinus acididurans]